MQFSFSRSEVRDITISAAVLAFAFGGFSGFLVALFIVGTCFVLHELAHKLAAQHFGFFAEYRMWPYGLLLALLSSLFGFVFAAPGAVYISPVKHGFAFRVAKLGREQFGLISLSGPATNIILGFVFLAFAISPSQLSVLLGLAARISFFLAFFNLFPIAPLDGKKIFSWNKIVWLAAAALALVGFLFAG